MKFFTHVTHTKNSLPTPRPSFSLFLEQIISSQSKSAIIYSYCIGTSKNHSFLQKYANAAPACDLRSMSSCLDEVVICLWLITPQLIFYEVCFQQTNYLHKKIGIIKFSVLINNHLIICFHHYHNDNWIDAYHQ